MYSQKESKLSLYISQWIASIKQDKLNFSQLTVVLSVGKFCFCFYCSRLTPYLRHSKIVTFNRSIEFNAHCKRYIHLQSLDNREFMLILVMLLRMRSSPIWKQHDLITVTVATLYYCCACACISVVLLYGKHSVTW